VRFAMGCGSSVPTIQDPEKFPTHLLFRLAGVRINSVALHRHEESSKEHVFQIQIQIKRLAH
jgi:hypothetical protein